MLFAPACYLMRWEQLRAGKKAAKKEKEWTSAMSKQRSRLGIPKKDGEMREKQEKCAEPAYVESIVPQN